MSTKLQLSRFELKIISTVLNQPGVSGNTISDLRRLRSAAKIVKGFYKDPPARPTPPKDATEEQKAAWVKECEEWAKKLQEESEETVEVDFPDDSFGIIKQRVGTFRGFYSDEMAREKALGLADKLGLK